MGPVAGVLVKHKHRRPVHVPIRFWLRQRSASPKFAIRKWWGEWCPSIRTVALRIDDGDSAAPLSLLSGCTASCTKRRMTVSDSLQRHPRRNHHFSNQREARETLVCIRKTATRHKRGE